MLIKIQTLKYGISLTTFQVWWILDSSPCSSEYLTRMRYMEPLEAVDFGRN